MSEEKLLQTKTKEKKRIVETLVEHRSNAVQVKSAIENDSDYSAEMPIPISSKSESSDELNADKLQAMHDAEKLLYDLPTDEFLNFLERSSPEQLELFLSNLAASKPVPQPVSSLFSSLVSIPYEPRAFFR